MALGGWGTGTSGVAPIPHRSESTGAFLKAAPGRLEMRAARMRRCLFGCEHRPPSAPERVTTQARHFARRNQGIPSA